MNQATEANCHLQEQLDHSVFNLLLPSLFYPSTFGALFTSSLKTWLICSSPCFKTLGKSQILLQVSFSSNGSTSAPSKLIIKDIIKYNFKLIQLSREDQDGFNSLKLSFVQFQKCRFKLILVIVYYKIMQCPSHVKKLQKITESKFQACQMCGRSACWQCKSCTFVQCDECRICNKRHGLVKIIELSKVKPEYYNNGYSCNSCSKSKNVDDDGIWHCNTCNYDLCPDCAE